jgi:hypothetical protein
LKLKKEYRNYPEIEIKNRKHEAKEGKKEKGGRGRREIRGSRRAREEEK